MSTKEITEQVEDALTYPILTQQVDSQQPSADTQGVPSAGGGSIESVAQSTIRRILGWRYRANDTKGFTAALTKTFALKDVEGHVEWEWKPQNYMVQADLGEVTGAQASIYSRAKAAMDQALPLLDALTPLREDADPEDCEAIRALVRSELKDQLVPELGRPRGPVVQLVEQMFTLLLGSTRPITDLETVGGHFGELRFRFGLERKRVNTVDEEVNLTNFLIVVDHVNSLYTTWIAQAKFLGRQGLAEPFLGTQLVLLSQQLEEVAESVREAYDAMDSVFFGPAERQTTQLKFDGQPFITVAELLGWVDNFATVNGPQWLQDSGKDGVALVSSTAEQLHELVKQASQKSRSSSSNPTRAFHTARVHRAFDVISDGLQATFNLANQIKPVDQPPPPKQVPIHAITKVSPPAYVQGTKDARLTIYGFGLSRFTQAFLDPSDPKQQVLSADAKDVTDSKLAATFDLTKAQPGIYTLILKDPSPLDQPIALKDAFTVTVPPPEIVAVEPLTSDQEDMVRLDIKGTGFQQNATVTLELQGSNRNPNGKITFLSDTQIVADFDLSLAIEGDWKLVVTNPDGQKSDPQPFPIVLPPPAIRSFVPRFGTEHQLLELTIYGHNFRPGIAVALQSRCAPEPIKCDAPAKVVGSNIVITEFSGATPAGQYYVIVTNQGGQSAWSEDLLEICRHGPPNVTSVDPAIIDEEEIVRFDIGGSGFQPKATVTLELQGSNRNPNGAITFLSDTQIVTDFDLSVVMEGDWKLVVKNPDGQKSDPQPFQIVLPPPIIRSFAPRVWDPTTQDLQLTVRGRYFRKDVISVTLQACEQMVRADRSEVISTTTILSFFKKNNDINQDSFYVAIKSGDFQAWSENSLKVCQDYQSLQGRPEFEEKSPEELAAQISGQPEAIKSIKQQYEYIKKVLSRLGEEPSPDMPGKHETDPSSVAATDEIQSDVPKPKRRRRKKHIN